MSGDINVDELWMNLCGMGYMAVGYSEQELVPPSPLDWLFPEGIDKGTRPYRIIEAAEGVSHDDLGRTKAGDVLDLNMCPAVIPQCELPGFNLT